MSDQHTEVLFGQIGRVFVALVLFGWAALLGSCAWYAAVDGARLVMEVFRAK